MSEYIYGSIGDPLANVLGEIYLPRAEVVRCRDCRYAMAYAKAAYCDYMNRVIWIDGFCAWGARKEVNNDNQ